ncbi:hypothetical protein KIH74_21915 [Kineosporia sp. J2-2]|uniref:DUF2180 family protein n=1 Tax=Kineosporia corallincola TaxID=2835133 RepID=A0ABS5TN32_9ACTN|nr:hypothetical protein [Kineosporia corallincola]MBT0771611.1 hypothetical protein [Kineosporia corallincola]
MHCLDCTLRFDMKIAAVASCHHCGAGICLDHTTVLNPAPAVIGMLPSEPARRVISCLACTPLPQSPNRVLERMRQRMRRSAGATVGSRDA